MGGGNAAGYAAKTFVEHGMANGKLCIVSKEVILVSFLFISTLFSLFCDIGAAFVLDSQCDCLQSRYCNYFLSG